MFKTATFFISYANDLMQLLMSTSAIRSCEIINKELVIVFSNDTKFRVYCILHLFYVLDDGVSKRFYINFYNLYDRILDKTLDKVLSKK